jgi:hypothetical protein
VAGAELLAVRVDNGIAVYSITEAHAALQAIISDDPQAAAQLLTAPVDRGATSVLFLNGPVDGAVADALAALGATQLARQHELAIRP